MDDVGDYVVDIKQAPAPPQLREGQVVAAVASAAHIAPASDVVVVEVSTTVDPHDAHDSHDSVTSSHAPHDDPAASHHDDATSDDTVTVDEAAPETGVTAEPAPVEAVAETHDPATDATADHQG